MLSSYCKHLMPKPWKWGLGMRNLQYELSIYQKINNKATIIMSSYFDFCWLTRYIVIQKLVKMGLSILRKAIIKAKSDLNISCQRRGENPTTRLRSDIHVCTMCLLVGPSASRACQTLDFGLVPREPQGGRHRRPWSISSLSYFI